MTITPPATERASSVRNSVVPALAMHADFLLTRRHCVRQRLAVTVEVDSNAIFAAVVEPDPTGPEVADAAI